MAVSTCQIDSRSLRKGSENCPAPGTESNIKLSAQTAFSQRNPSPYETETNGYTLVNLGLYSEIIVTKQTLALSFSVNNLFDTQYYDHLSTLKSMNYHNQGRNIS